MPSEPLSDQSRQSDTLRARGAAALRNNDYAQAAVLLGQELEADPGSAELYCAYGAALSGLRQFDRAIASYDKAIALQSACAEGYAGRGAALLELKRLEAAASNLQLALLLKPDFAAAHFLMGETLRGLNDSDGVRSSYRSALAADPHFDLAAGLALFMDMQLCDWPAAEAGRRAVLAAIDRNENATPPFPVLAMIDSPAVQKAVTERYARATYPRRGSLGEAAPRKQGAKIHIGYYSADFENHPVMQLIAGIFEAHDRASFELTAFSFGRDTQDEMRLRVSPAFDRFLDARMMSDDDVVGASRDLGIDIAVDLTGYTRDRRTGVFAGRAAPIQVGFLGYPGTMGADYFDYIVADKTLIPADSRRHYTEKVVYLPHTYQCNDRKRTASARVFSRAEAGLPHDAFVFCCFNNNFKISPAIFEAWIRILKRVEGSVLWLMEDNPTAAANLRKAAQEGGLDPARVVFAGRMPAAEHLARHTLADLFLDTLPYNAHTTASDALWMGLPVLTCLGESFAGRVAGSLLRAVGLPELVTNTREDYESLAVKFATDRLALAAIKDKLLRSRLSAPLFDTQMFAVHIEAAYSAILDRHRAGLPPDHIEVME